MSLKRLHEMHECSGDYIFITFYQRSCGRRRVTADTLEKNKIMLNGTGNCVPTHLKQTKICLIFCIREITRRRKNVRRIT